MTDLSLELQHKETRAVYDNEEESVVIAIIIEKKKKCKGTEDFNSFKVIYSMGGGSMATEEYAVVWQ